VATWSKVWVRISLRAWSWVLSGRGLCIGLITHPEESYRAWCVWVWSRILHNEEAIVHWGGGCCAMVLKKKKTEQATNIISSAITLKLFPTFWWHNMHTYLLPNVANYFTIQLLCYLWRLYFVQVLENPVTWSELDQMTQKLFSWLLHKLRIIHQNIHFTMEAKRDEHCPSLHTDIYRPVAYPGILFGGGFNKLSWGQREWGSGSGSPPVTGSGGSCNLVQEISFHIVKFS